MLLFAIFLFMDEDDQATVARAVLPILEAEQDHLKYPEVIRRPRETEVRATCGTFSIALCTSFFFFISNTQIHA